MKTVLIGMNDPNRFTDDALSPHHTCGKTLFKLSGMSLDEYEEAFERINIVGAKEWSFDKASHEGVFLRQRLEGRRVVVLGRQVWKALFLAHMPWFKPLAQGDDTVYVMIPHPSGRNLLYNNPIIKRKARQCLRTMSR
jgi:hypothetical protein